MSARKAEINSAEATQTLLNIFGQYGNDSDLDCHNELTNDSEAEVAPTISIQELEELTVDKLEVMPALKFESMFYAHFSYFIKCIIFT